MKAKCDNCKEEFDFVPKTRNITSEIKEVYFECSECNTKYHSYYLDKTVKDLMAENGELQLKLQDTEDEETFKHIMEHIKENKKLIKEEQENIKNLLERQGLING